MATLRIHHDGSVALPESFRRQLGLERDRDLEAELVDGTIMLRPREGLAKAKQEGAPAEAMPAQSALAARALSPEQLAASPDVPPTPKRRGRLPKAKPV